MSDLNIYEVHHDGVWLNGISIVVAQDEARALHLTKLALTQKKISTEGVSVYRRIHPDDERAYVVWDGDY